MPTHLIGIDWGTSHVRGFRFGPRGEVLETRRTEAGLKSVAVGTWTEAFATHFADWTESADGPPVLLCGMVGSRQGWSEAPYLACPLSVDALAANLHVIPQTAIRIVPGLSTCDDAGVPDVMRGEETLIAGLDTTGDRIVCLPGTHSKWVQITQGKIARFRTYMTGELFDLLSRHSILAQTQEPGDFDETAFLTGVDRAATSGSLLQNLFSVRTLRLTGSLTSTGQPDYLSGLLIGHELQAVRDLLAPGDPVSLVGSTQLTHRYATALQHRQRPVDVTDGETAAARGLWSIAAQAQLTDRVRRPTASI